MAASPARPAIAEATMFPWVTAKILGIPLYAWMYLLAGGLFFVAASATFLRRGLLSVPQCLGVWVVLFGSAALGGKAFELLDNLSYYLAQPQRMWQLAGHGINGALLFSSVFTVLYLRAIRKRVLESVDVFFYYAPIAIAIGRLSCLITADGDYGTPTDLPWGMTFSYGYFPTEVAVHPTPLYEIIILLLLFVVLKVAVYGKRPAGWTSAVFLMVYSIQRFLIELIRLNKRHALGLTLAQWVCLVLFLASVVLFVHLWRKSKSPGCASTSSDGKSTAAPQDQLPGSPTDG